MVYGEAKETFKESVLDCLLVCAVFEIEPKLDKLLKNEAQVKFATTVIFLN